MCNKTNYVKILAVLFILLAFVMTSHGQTENKTFSEVCQSCHTGGFKGWLSGAPNVKDKSKWEKYIKRDPVEKMKEIVLKGTKDHKAKGGCEKCSDGEIRAAVDYMMLLVR